MKRKKDEARTRWEEQRRGDEKIGNRRLSTLQDASSSRYAASAMTLLDLPNEVLAKILFWSTTASLMQLLITCKRLFHLASTSRHVIQRHIRQIPGRRRNFRGQHKSTQELFSLLRRRAAADLQGVDLTADRHDFYFDGHQIDPLASCMGSMKDHSVHVGLVLKSCPAAHVYHVSGGQLRLVYVASMEPADSITFKQPIQASFDSKGAFFALFKVREDSGSESNPQMRDCRIQTTKPPPSPLNCIVSEKHVNTRLEFPMSKDRRSRDAEDSMSVWRWKPFSMAARDDGVIAIAWEQSSFGDGRQWVMVELLTIQPHEEYLDNVEAIATAEGREIMKNVQIEPRSLCWYRWKTLSCLIFDKILGVLKHYTLGAAMIPYSIEQIGEGCGSINYERVHMSSSRTLTTQFFLETPFFMHTEHQTLPHNGMAFRINTRLCLALSLLKWSKKSIYIVRRREAHSVERQGPYDDDIRVVARLAYWCRRSASLPLVSAHSRKGTRIAIPQWDEILVWPVLPEILAHRKPRLKGYRRRIYDADVNSRLVELVPVVLQADAVVHKLAFTEKEDEIIAITDRGVQVWNLGPCGTGRRTATTKKEGEMGRHNSQDWDSTQPTTTKHWSVKEVCHEDASEGIVLQQWTYSDIDLDD